MTRTLIPCALALALASTLAGGGPAGQGPPKEAAPTRTVIALTVDAAAAPKPALRYTLLPELKEMQQGNPLYAYTKCFAEQNNFYYNKRAVEERERWQTMPLADLPHEKVLATYGGKSLRQADYAARLDSPDWQLLARLRSDGIDLLLPDLQPLRMLAGALKVRFRAEVAAGRFDDATRTAATLFALSRHLGEHPTLIGNLVGIAVAQIAIGPLEEMIGRPGCPNLYWALTDLPGPFIDLRKGMQGERLLLDKEFAPFDRDTPVAAAELDRAVARFDLLFAISREGPGAGGSKPSVTLGKRLKDAAAVRAARRRLVAAGASADRVRELPALQVLLLDEKATYEALRDDTMKWTQAPWPQAEAALTAKGGKSSALFEPLVPTIARVLRVRTRLDQRIALLRHVEAVRLYAAAHGGKPPASLADVEVPLPADPFTGKPFGYKVEGKKVMISGAAPRGEEKAAGFNIRYEVTVR